MYSCGRAGNAVAGQSVGILGEGAARLMVGMAHAESAGLQNLILTSARSFETSSETEVELEGQLGQRSAKKSISFAKHRVIIQPPALVNVRAVGVCMLELRGRMDVPALVQQDITAAAETHTLHVLDNPSNCGIPDLACTTSASVLPLSTSVLSSITAYLDFERVCVIDRMCWISYLVGCFREGVSLSLLWVREGIDTHTWNKLRRHGRATTH
ncbi:hypothetical protein B0H14DRAFT_3565836 [Mycena olivaceomarginata]|nr:hypothetical protein B0H14DRAFT_3565836 [Mycena olivaceomarginata]